MKKFSTRELSNIMGDIDAQPDWRTPANKCCQYYDSEQLPPDVKARLQEMGQPELVFNLIKPVVNGVLGMEARTRSDLIITADDPNEEIEDMVNALNEQYKDIRRLCDAEIAESDAYASMIKSGVGWMELYRNPHPMQSPYKMQFVHRDEIYWDSNCKQRDLSDCRWLLRRRWIDYDEAYTMFPDKKDILKRSINNDWDSFIGDVNTQAIEGNNPGYEAAWAEYQKFTRKETEWLQPKRKRVLLQCVYYSVFEQKVFLEFENGRVEEYDNTNRVQNAFVATGKATVRVAPVRSIREAWFVGPTKVRDVPCKAPHGWFPLVPLWGYRRDANNMPYGMIADMISPQDSVNFRYIKLTAALNHKTVIMDEDATNLNDRQVKEQVNSVDGLIKLNAERRNKKTIDEAFQIRPNADISSQQFQLALDSRELIEQTAGVYSAMLGEGKSGQSGVAINNLIEQGATTLAEINDNYRYGRLMLGRLLMLYLFEDMKKKKNVKVTVFKDDKSKRKQVILNAEVSGEPKLTNDITKLRSHVALAPIQQTPTFRAQMAQQLTQVTQNLPPEVQMSVIDMILELMDIPNKSEYLDRVRGALGINKPAEQMTPEEQAAQQAQAQAEQAAQEMQQRAMNAEVTSKEADAASKQAEALRKQREIQSMDVKDGKTQAETAKVLSEVEAADQETIRNNAGMLQQMSAELDQVAL
ncbi:portal protein [Vibrio phage D85]|nr:portal protein [Vibrio phage 252E42.2]